MARRSSWLWMRRSLGPSRTSRRDRDPPSLQGAKWPREVYAVHKDADVGAPACAAARELMAGPGDVWTRRLDWASYVRHITQDEIARAIPRTAVSGLLVIFQ